jgi:hypothetical protein
MKKDQILIIFETRQRGLWFFKDNIQSLMPDLKKKSNHIYENDKTSIKICALDNDIRGFSPSFIFLSNDCTIENYQKLVLPLVRGDHGKIKVVF